jgi:hypothetical protein
MGSSNLPKCPKCKRAYWGIYRRRIIVEYRILSTENDRLVRYKGNWKSEMDSETEILGIRCMSCGHETSGEDLKGVSEIMISSKGVVFATDFWDVYV